ncbi:MAG TPA: DUF2158 domain-containing protein [Vicinamibacterales bacterium]|nr:DUF2158 domain-containing protein [Vicinamibacterales bacterium]
MAEQLFQAGNVVRLKSGGPKMTIVNYAKNDHYSETVSYKCKWFDDKGYLTQDNFAEAELELMPQVATAGQVLRSSAR